MLQLWLLPFFLFQKSSLVALSVEWLSVAAAEDELWVLLHCGDAQGCNRAALTVTLPTSLCCRVSRVQLCILTAYSCAEMGTRCF